MNFPQLQRINTKSRKYLIVLLVLLFVIVSIFGSRFHYSIRNSGLYLLPVIRTLDPDIFKNDSAVDSLGKFSSLFYEVLSFGVRTFGVSPDNLVSVLRVIYAISKALLMVLVFILAYQLKKDLWLFLLMAAWVSHVKLVPVGNILLFKPLLTHETMAFLLGVTALIFLLRRNYSLFWLALGFSILFHSIMAFHLFLCVAPAAVLMDKFRFRFRFKKHLIGLILLVIFSLVYLLLMAPPFLSSREATIFFIEKGACKHVSPFNQSFLGWVHMLGVIALAYLANKFILKKKKSGNLIGLSLLCGTGFGLALSFAAVVTKVPLFALIQPMRIFLWVTFLAYLLIALAAVQTLRQNSQVGVILSAIIVLSVLNSLWSLMFVFAAIAYLIIEKYWALLSRHISFSFPAFVFIGITLAVCVMIFSWIFQLGHPHSPSHLPAGLLIFLMSLTLMSKKNYCGLLVFILVGYSVIGTSFFRHDYFAGRMNLDWDKTRLWCRDNTDESDKFITPPDGNNFRIISLRSTVSEEMLALLWVDPFEYVKNQKRVSLVEQSRLKMKWNLKNLFSLAQKWGATYVVTEGAFEPIQTSPAFSSGDFCVFRVPD